MSSLPGFFYIAGIFFLLSLAVIVGILVNRRRKVARKTAPEGTPEDKKWGRPEAWGVVVAVLALASSTAIGVAQLVSSQGVPASAQSGSGHINYVGQSIPVEGRSASPSDIGAPGIALTNPQAVLEFSSLAGIPEKLTFRDLNTIVATSKVPVYVNLALDQNLNIPFTATSLRRLQYVADLIGMQDGNVELGGIGYIRSSSGNEVAAPVFIVNGKSAAVAVTNLEVTVWNENGSKKLLRGDFFSETDSLSVAAKTSLFTYLIFSKNIPASFPPPHYSTKYSINWQS
jgi:hypothetical protein